MHLNIFRDTRIRAVEWHDLVPLSLWEIVRELCISLPWLLLSLFLAWHGWYLFALPASFLFFLTGLRQAHNAHHHALGLPRRATESVLLALSALMLGSMHAIQITHLHHHKHCMDEEDTEAESARMSAGRAILFGPLFPIRLHCKAWMLARPAQKVWIAAELAINGLLLLGALWFWPLPAFRYHLAAMLAGQCLTAFFAVWTVHHDCDRSHFIARTLRSRWKNWIAYDMFFHVEHHLFPRVPTCHLAQLAARLDVAAPELQEKTVF